MGPKLQIQVELKIGSILYICRDMEHLFFVLFCFSYACKSNVIDYKYLPGGSVSLLMIYITKISNSPVF